MPTETKTILSQIANTIRGLALDAIDAANSGHPGLPLGCGEIMAVLYGRFLRHDPSAPNWRGRDRFILSAGHGSMALYSSLHLAGFGLSIEDLKKFRQLHSPTAGHPEFGEAAGIETTTGPLGQGIATAVGLALADKHVAARTGTQALLTNQTVVLVGDGCIMEGISAEASSLAGHLKLDNLIVIYDSNDICLDGPISETLSEDVSKRYSAYGWHVTQIDGHDIIQVENALDNARNRTDAPSLIIAKTTIGKGSPKYEGSSEAHGKAFGPEESLATKHALGITNTTPFSVQDEIYAYFTSRRQAQTETRLAWESAFSEWAANHSESAALWNQLTNTASESIETAIRSAEVKTGLATRAISQALLQLIHDGCPNVIGGSADLSCSDSTLMKKGGILSADNFSARNIKYGVREFAMAAINSGLYLSGNLKPFCGTFLTFSDYMKNAIRLAALMNLGVTYQFTHDSLFLGEDGPTHQPIEHLAGLRSMPNLTVFRPADINETKASWIHALRAKNPTALILSRQGINDSLPTSIDGALKGGYILQKESEGSVDYAILATGSELSLAVETADALRAKGRSCRVISLPSFELFDAQSEGYRNDVLGQANQYVSIEAQSSFGWHKYVGRSGVTVAIDQFGLSAPAKELAKQFGFTVDAILARLGETSA